MKDVIWKLRILWQHYLPRVLNDWKREIWTKDPDQYFCCDGRECGCYGMSIREAYERNAA